MIFPSSLSDWTFYPKSMIDVCHTMYRLIGQALQFVLGGRVEGYLSVSPLFALRAECRTHHLKLQNQKVSTSDYQNIGETIQSVYHPAG